MKEEKEGIVDVHIIHRHIPFGLVLLTFATLIGGAALTAFYYGTQASTYRIVFPEVKGVREPLVYGSLPALENASFFDEVRSIFLSSKSDFIEADLSAMMLRVYHKGTIVKEAPILSKGREGSWWETPAGLYKVEAKKENHFSGQR